MTESQEDFYSTGYCLTTTQLEDTSGWSIFSILLVILVSLDFIALLLTVFFIWMESLEKQAYKKAKDKPVKLLLTQEYLTQLRPPKKAPAPSPTDLELQSTKQ